MNIAEAFVEYMVSLGLGVAGTDIHIGGIPQDADTDGWWVVLNGGAPDSVNETGEMMKNYILNVYYRNIDQQEVYDQMQVLEEAVNSPTCIELTDFDTISVMANSFPVDQDIDSQERTVGLVQVTIKVYSE